MCAIIVILSRSLIRDYLSETQFVFTELGSNSLTATFVTSSSATLAWTENQAKAHLPKVRLILIEKSESLVFEQIGNKVVELTTQ